MMETKDILFQYIRYLYSIRQSDILREVIESMDHPAWEVNVLIMISCDECDEVTDEFPNKKILTLWELAAELQIISREKTIDKILDK